jgi:hypothetical protein
MSADDDSRCVNEVLREIYRNGASEQLSRVRHIGKTMVSIYDELYEL